MKVKQDKIAEIDRLKTILASIDASIEKIKRNGDSERELRTKEFNRKRCNKALNVARDELAAILYAEKRK